MKKKIIILFSIHLLSMLFVPAFLKAQSDIDSLEALIENATGREKFNLLIDVAEEYTNNNPEKSVEFANQALSVAKEMEDEKAEAKAMHLKGQAYYFLYEFDKALEIYNKCLQFCDETKNSKESAAVYNSIGMLYYYKNELDKAEENLKKALKISDEIDNREQKARALRFLGRTINRKGNPNEALNTFKEALEIYKELDDKNGIASTNNSIGLIYFNWDKYDTAIYYYDKTKETRSVQGDKRGEGIALVNMGNVYWRWGKYDEAIVNYQDALAIFEEIDFKNGIASCLNNIGLIYGNLTKESLIESNLQNFKKAMEYHRKAYEVRKKLGNEVEMANSLNNIGTIYYKMQDQYMKKKYGEQWVDSVDHLEPSPEIFPYVYKALDSYKEAYEMYKRNDYKQGVSSSLSNQGRIYLNYLRQYDKARDNVEESLEIARELNNQYEILNNLFQLATIYKKQKRYDKALDYFNQVLDIATKNNMNEFRKSSFENISEIHEAENNYKRALTNYKRFVGVRDSIFNEKNSKIIENLNAKYETAKKEQAIKLQEQQINQQKMLIFIFIGVFIVIIAFMVIVFRQNNQIKKKSLLLAQQNELISKQKEEITDSIHYASRIQRALLPQDDYVNNVLPEHFILFRPRDIVSGDFYYINKHNDKTIVVASDCTGHGVPGAFMSMLGVSFFNEIIGKHKEIHADQMLNELRDMVINSLHQTGEEGQSKDGMDLALYILDHENMQVEFAGANNPLVIIRDGEIIQYKADKMPIGIYVKKDVPFQKQIVDLKKGDCLYTFSDGYQDQFGGPKNKKFMIKHMKNMFVENYQKPMEEQGDIYNQCILDWMGGDEHNQVDDIILIGIRV